MNPKYIALLPVIAQAALYNIPKNSDLIGKIQHTNIMPGETLATIAKDYSVGIDELIRANPKLNPKAITVGTNITIPTKFILPEKSIRHGIVVNMAELRLYYFPENANVVYTYPVAMGRAGWRTPTSTTKITGKTKDPIWNVPQSIRIYSLDKYGKVLPKKVMPGPKNPLGKYAIYLKQKGILIHGTNNPSSIGKHVSSGCIRMLNSNVRELYKMVKVGDIVYLVHHDHKLGHDEHGRLHLESHPKVNLTENKSAYNHVDIHTKLSQHKHDPDKARNSIVERHGVPKLIGG